MLLQIPVFVGSQDVLIPLSEGVRQVSDGFHIPCGVHAEVFMLGDGIPPYEVDAGNKLIHQLGNAGDTSCRHRRTGSNWCEVKRR